MRVSGTFILTLSIEFYPHLEKNKSTKERTLFPELYLVLLSFRMHGFVPSKM